MSVVGLLRQNNPTRTYIWLRLEGEPSDAALAQALEQNPFVRGLEMDLVGVQRTDWDSFLRVIARRASLEDVTLQCAGLLMGLQDAVSVDRRNAPAGLVRALLHAIQQNTSIRSVDLCSIRLPTDVSTFVNTASSITSFSITDDCDMEAVGRDRGARDLAAALQCNTNIKTLKISRLEDIYAVPILEGLGSNVSLKTFIFTPISTTNISDATFRALQRLLESTTSILRFEFCVPSFSDERLFRPIAQGIINNESVSELKFSGFRFRFEGRDSPAPLQSILLNKRNLTSLCLHECDFVGGQFHEDIISLVSRPDSLLRSFEFQSHNALGGGFSRIQFENLVRAIEKSKLERFQIGSIEAPRFLQALTQSIPSMKLKELEVKFWDNGDSDDEDEPEGGFDREAIRQDLLNAAKNNFSLRSVAARIDDYSGEELDLFESIEDKQTLELYANRNECLDQWVDHPETVEQKKVWPDALGLAEKAGPDALFRGLRSVLERDYGSLPGGRKRKRPQYYTPA